MMRIISETGLQTIKDYEGYSSTPYLCKGKKWTIGWGTTLGVTPSHPEITRDQAEAFIRRDLKTFETAVNKLVKVNLTQNQFDALVIFVYNIGIGNFRASTLLKVLNNGDYQEAAKEFHRWNKADGVVLKGLIRRRKEESELFCKIN